MPVYDCDHSVVGSRVDRDHEQTAGGTTRGQSGTSLYILHLISALRFSLLPTLTRG